MRRTISLCTIAVLALTGVIAWNATHDVSAQDAKAVHPIVGTWWWENISDDPFDDSYAIFNADGTYVEETSYIGAGIGSWVATGENTADLLIVFQDVEGGLDPTAPAAFVPGTITFRLSIEVDESGKAIVAKGSTEVREPGGAVTDAFEFEGTANKIGIDWIMPVASPTS